MNKSGKSLYVTPALQTILHCDDDRPIFSLLETLLTEVKENYRKENNGGNTTTTTAAQPA
jgi:hypothetical protein